MDVINQKYLDAFILWVADKKTNVAGILCDLMAQGDPATDDLIIKLMAVQVLQKSVRHYDINNNVFTQEELIVIEEKIMRVLSSCPNYG